MQQNPRKYYFALAVAVQQRIRIITDHQFAWNLRLHTLAKIKVQ